MSVWDDIADTAEESLKVRAASIRANRSRVTDAGWSQATAAEYLRRGKASKFSLDALVGIASSLGIHVRVEVASGRTRAIQGSQFAGPHHLVLVEEKDRHAGSRDEFVDLRTIGPQRSPGVAVDRHLPA